MSNAPANNAPQVSALDVLYKEALAELNNKEYLAAKRKLDAFCLSRTDNPTAFLNLAICYINLRDNVHAIEILEKLWPLYAKQAPSKRHYIIMLLATVYLQHPLEEGETVGLYDEKGMSFFEQGLNNKALQAPHFINASIVYLRHQKYKRAAAILRIALHRFDGKWATDEEKESCYINLIAATDAIRATYLTIYYGTRMQALFPNSVNNYSTLSLNYYRTQQYEASLEFAIKGLALDPYNASLLGNKATALRWLGRTDEANEVYVFLKQHNLMNDTTWANYALLCESCGRYEEALQIIQQEIDKIGHETESLCFYRAQINLRLAHFKHGFKEYQHRWHEKDKKRTYGCKRPGIYWRDPSENLQGKSLYIHYEQGFGDSILYARFAMMAKEITKARAVFLETQPSMKQLLQQLPNIDGVYSYNEPQPYSDYSASLLSLPYLLDCMEDGKVPYANGYLSSPFKLEQPIKTPKFKIAIAWRGNPDQPVERFRAIPIEFFVNLAKRGDVALFNVQPDACAREIKEQNYQSVIKDVSGALDSFSKTAAFLAECDLVISSCTALANLAGAMGKECWVICSMMGDWRWGTNDRQTSLWYNSVDIIRQPKMWDWQTPFQEVHKRLDAKIAQKNTTKRV